MNNEQLNQDLKMENTMDRYDERVGFGRRLGAYLLDLLVIFVLGLLLKSIAGEFFSALFYGDQLADTETAVAQFESMGFNYEELMTKVWQISASTSLITILMFILEGLKGQSVGKMILKIKNTNPDGSEANAKTLWLRAALKYGSTVLALIGALIGVSFIGTIGSIWNFVIFIGFFFAFADKKQTIHDMIAKTVVVRT
jgi:uncharacterized RDD family membrane protein YckC